MVVVPFVAQMIITTLRNILVIKHRVPGAASTSASKVEHCSTLNLENPENLRSPAHNAFRRKVRESDVTPFKVNGRLLCRRSVTVNACISIVNPSV